MDYRKRLSYLYLGPDRHAWLSAPNLLTLADAWAACPRGDWMFAVLCHMHPIDKGCAIHTTQVSALCDCVELAFHLVPAEKVVAYRELLDIVRAWTRGEASEENVNRARSALEWDRGYRPYHPEMTAMRWAALAVPHRNISADAIRLIADAIPRAAGHDYTSSNPTLTQCADIVRRYFPTPPRLEILL